MNQTPSVYERELYDRYEGLYKLSTPGDEWIPATPPVPFVGADYGNGVPRVLVYASAENLAWWEPDTSLDALRNRRCFEKWSASISTGNASYFPTLHMDPATDGTLLVVARYLLAISLPDESFSSLPENFLQQIAIGNYGKFAIAGRRNADYASDARKLAVSKPYTLADLDVLKPDIAILPRSIHRNAYAALLSESKSGPGRVWCIYQTNRGNVNRLVRPQLRKAGIIDSVARRFDWMDEWLRHIPATKGMDSFVDWLYWRSGHLGGQNAPDWLIDEGARAR